MACYGGLPKLQGEDALIKYDEKSKPRSGDYEPREVVRSRINLATELKGPALDNLTTSQLKDARRDLLKLYAEIDLLVATRLEQIIGARTQ